MSFQDPDYVERLFPDEQRFTDTSKFKVTIGDEFVVIQKGRILEPGP